MWWAFSSCTSTIQVLKKPQFLGRTGLRTVFAIECKKYSTSFDVSQYENEILLMPATQLEVIGQYHPSPDVYMIQMKETESLFPLRDSI